MLPMEGAWTLQSGDIDKRPDDGFRLYGVCAATQGHEDRSRGPLLALDHGAGSGPRNGQGLEKEPWVRLEGQLSWEGHRVVLGAGAEHPLFSQHLGSCSWIFGLYVSYCS